MLNPLRDHIREVVEQVAEISRKSVQAYSGIQEATVISRNPDGSVNVDDGSGGCARTVSLTNQRIECGNKVVLGAEAQIGQQQQVCPTSFTMTSSTKPCPGDTREEEDDTEVVPAPTGFVFVDNRGYVYDYQTGEVLAVGDGDMGTYLGVDYEATEGDFSYGYSYDLALTLNYVGALDDADLSLFQAPNYDDVLIGNYSSAPDNAGYQGENYTINNGIHIARLVLGQGPSTDRLVGLELVNDAVGDHGPNWTIVCRQLSDFSILWTDAGSYLTDWINDFFYDDPNTFGVSVAADADGSFWIVPVNGRTDGNDGPNPVFNIDPSDGSLIRTVELATPNASGFFLYARPVPIGA